MESILNYLGNLSCLGCLGYLGCFLLFIIILSRTCFVFFLCFCFVMVDSKIDAHLFICLFFVDLIIYLISFMTLMFTLGFDYYCFFTSYCIFCQFVAYQSYQYPTHPPSPQIFPWISSTPYNYSTSSIPAVSFVSILSYSVSINLRRSLLYPYSHSIFLSSFSAFVLRVWSFGLRYCYWFCLGRFFIVIVVDCLRLTELFIGINCCCCSLLPNCLFQCWGLCYCHWFLGYLHHFYFSNNFHCCHLLYHYHSYY